MSKFYVQSGQIRIVLHAENAQLAALSAVDSVMNPHRWIYNDNTLSDDIRRDHLMVEALCHLDAVIQISEQGFDRCDATILDSPEFVEEWHILMTRLSDLYVAAGLPPRALPLPRVVTNPSLAT